jgi:hypothetical protein
MALYNLIINSVTVANLESSVHLEVGEHFYLMSSGSPAAYTVADVTRRVNPGVPGDIAATEYFEVIVQAV